MKQLLLIPLTLGLAALLGYGLLRVSGRPVYLHEMSVAGVPVLVAAIAAALMPMIRRADGQLAVVQAAHVGMILLLGLSIGLGVVAFLLAGIHGPSIQPFALWMMWFYAVALVLVSRTLIRVIRTTPMEAGKQ